MSKPLSKRPIVISVLIFILFVIAGSYFAIRADQRGWTTAVPDIQVTPDISLHFYTALTQKNHDLRTVKSSVFVGMLPAVIRKKLFPSWSSGITYGGLERDAIEFVYKANYPEAWNSTKKSDQIAEDIQNEITKSGLAYARLEYGPGSYGAKWNLIVNSYPVTSHSSGSGSSPSDYKPFVSFTVNHVPVDQKKLTLQFMPFADNDRNDVARTVTLSNPIYTPVTPLSNPQSMPATQTDGTMEVTLRTLVTQAGHDQGKTLLYKAGENRLAFIENKPIPETGPVAADFFPRAAGTPKQPYETIAFFSITKEGEGQDEWAGKTYRYLWNWKLRSFHSI